MSIRVHDFVLCGAMTVLLAVGLGHALPAMRWASRRVLETAVTTLGFVAAVILLCADVVARHSSTGPSR